MEQLVILSKLEQEYLLGAIEAALQVREPRRFFLWTQGQLQALLPHRILVCLHFGPAGEVLHVECVHGTVLGEAALARLADPVDGLAVRLARHCLGAAPGCAPAALEAEPAAPRHPLAAFQPELRAARLDNVLLHGTERLPGGASCFALFGMPHRPGPRQGYFLELLLPHLHLALMRLRADAEGEAYAGVAAAGQPARPRRQVSQRELEILHWVREGKSNDEVGQILGISGYTVKNHLQRIYKTLGVSNRAQAVAHGISLRLLASASAPPMRRQ
ncbi:XrtB/PEP-CTERM-associated transcriptional regulator EpsA [Pseudoduganella namucuonensis]|uniref:Transcriptional regulator, LuxR family n=1 Tax=Pseudoduganella namucuonensis TaxID=1035707 RepID=A0A1I7LY75_9BURK|nr:XrtB/PEP-CTERM-associated transcriptional regulator EpsA [Pseudoduganella namucuonensis]SFV14609.1 transcriptional regulator, LuxR family [Pseudoduganella namucuonensis]